MKIIRTLVLVAAIVFGALLWFTRIEWMNSQSEFALADNNYWYRLMHISIILTFMLDAIVYDRAWSFLVAVATVGILMFNMYEYPLTHNIMTGVMAVLAAGNLIYFSSKVERPRAMMNVGVGTLCFLLGLLVWDFHLYLGESIIEFTLGVALVRRIWIEE